jgi:tetratricopeptide (TPR) repeat protein
MLPRFLPAVAIGALLCAGPLFVPGLCAPVLADEPLPNPHAPGGAPTPDWMKPPGDTPKVGRGERIYNLDTLFEALKIAPDAASAKAIEERIWALWIVSGSDTCNLLMARAKAAADDKDYALGIKLLDAIIELKPNYTEAWNRRATLHYLQKDYGQALADIREVLTREPRHFGALSGLGLILQELGDEKHALEAYRRALAIDPHLEHLDDAVKSLSEKVEGRNI